MNKPILFLVFNRPEPTARVMETIRLARPPRLYVAADGPRDDRPRDAELCAEARRIAQAVDWPCETHVLFRDRNLGCGRGVAGGIDWFFEHERDGLILEDDCIADPSFFTYCEELLDRYADDERVMSISGSTPLPAVHDAPTSYYFSKHISSWGWASWRRAWRSFDYDMRRLADFLVSDALQILADGSPGFEAHWRSLFERMARHEIDTWDYQWLFSIWCESGLNCMPWRNLVSNIGFGDDATHTVDVASDYFNRPRHGVSLPLIHPPIVCRDLVQERLVDMTKIAEYAAQPPSRVRRLIGKVAHKARAIAGGG